jgi:pimeloyl-ACP methyl ester carboxylesterase
MAEENATIPETSNPTSLDNPHVDKVINAGTTASNCQPKHTRESLKSESDDGVSSTLSADSSVLSNSSRASRQQLRKERKAEKKAQKEETKLKKLEEKQKAKDEKDLDPRKMGYLQMAKMGYQELVNAIIRPPRAEYKEESLGPPAFVFCGRRFTRTDFALVTKRGLNLQCSHWEPVERTSDRIPVVIYMHGNSSARVEVIPQLSYLLSLGLAVFSFDFAGSGKSDGEYVSLGYYEREDLMCVIAHLRATNVVSTIALWGRSMGAATALMHGDRDPSIACMILDSPFSDLTTLAEEMVEKGKEQGINVPGFVTSIALRLIRGSVKKQAGVDIRDIAPISHADKCFIPALFVAGEHDDFINKRHSEMIHAVYAGDKNMIVVEGDHNSPRPKFMFDSVSIFLQTCLQIPNSWALATHPGMNLMAPPWMFPGTRTSKTRRPTSARASATAASTNQNNDEIGMTAERQREIQASLFKMLGQQDDEVSAQTK